MTARSLEVIDIPGKVSGFNSDDFVQAYLAGSSIKQLMHRFRVGHATVLKQLAEAGVELRSISDANRARWVTRRRSVANLDELIARYVAGCSLKQLSDESGLVRSSLALRFHERGVDLRGQSEAESVKWSQRRQRPDYREILQRQAGRAWALRRGQRDSWEVRIQRARARMDRLTFVGRFERQILNALASRRERVVAQYALGPYNLDLALPERAVAVEVVSLSAHQASVLIAGSCHPERVKYILNHGWHVLAVFGRSMDPSGVADHVIAFAQSTGGAQSASRQYRVIGSDGQAVPVPRLDM